MPTTFTTGLKVLVAAFSLAVAGAAQAQIAQPIRIIFPFAPGGGGDGLARLIAEAIRKDSGEQVIVENRVGADGRIGVRAGITAAADGRTLLFSPIAPIVIHPSIYPDLQYNPLTDLKPISLVARFEYALSTGPLTSTKELPDTVAWLRQHPKNGAFGSPGNGGIPQFLGILFGQQAKLDIRHVPYRGSMPILNDVAAGQVALGVTPTSDAVALHEGNKIRIVATSGTKRSTLLPDVPTFSELGYKLTGDGWYSLYAPQGTPEDIVQKYSALVAAAVKTPEAKNSFGRLGFDLVGSTSQELSDIQKAAFEQWEAPAKQFRIE
ncbi:tripartite tricarboxylate transporter substrate-binding protein [Methylocella sp. CPCC 101449]|uniref:tripartite tricarboxylate transporter substrate-binding protein n=1 Tax=Methylocella sp. CPCC 101449 TaxID=2987531 RepID=UPI0028921B01|nr:tripartite tricarboxylate transporter substrate-binding protein [Methylocella sp. CPCC 101449]MDT2022532.1 tripartite tricarboxylate transporter substrate-binding protein [Methylocella sp. CPCC 101449]